jgi:hypothetical protein
MPSSIPVNEGKVRARVEGLDMEGVHVVVGRVVKAKSNGLHVCNKFSGRGVRKVLPPPFGFPLKGEGFRDQA